MKETPYKAQGAEEGEFKSLAPGPRHAALPHALPFDDLTERAGQLSGLAESPFAGDAHYDGFFERFFRALYRGAPRHVLLLRQRGVGEQAVLLAAAWRGLRGEPPFLAGRRFVATDLRPMPCEELWGIVATMFAAVSQMEHIVLCVDSFSKILSRQGMIDNRAAMLSTLEHCKCRVVGILSPHEYEELVSSNPAARDMFSIVRLHEPDAAMATKLVSRYAEGLGAQFDVKIDNSAVERAVVLTGNYILHERLPAKAVKVIRSVCEDIDYERSQQSSARREVTETDIVMKVAEMIGVPFETLAGVGDEVDYHANLAEIIVGQEHAVREVATELGLIKAGFVDTGKPASVMLFIGQTGTGKTEMAKALARFYSSSKKLKTFTLGNFSEPHSVSGIIGVPAGYVGHDQGGRLVNELNADPYGVFLLDEADKAHPDVMQPFLNLFDEGWVLDQRGMKAYADRAIFILTTNVGQRQIADLCKSGKSIDEITSTMKESLSRIRHTKSNRPVFSPEFLARVKRIVVFRSLDQAAMHGICQRLLAQLKERWLIERQKSLEVEDTLVDAIARRAALLDQKSQGKEGGRIVRKLLADVVESRIQSAISRDVNAYRTSHSVSVAAPCGVEAGKLLNDETMAQHAEVRFLLKTV
jgi:ATP-dependent Clp protease ATP-binding subunit ClpC